MLRFTVLLFPQWEFVNDFHHTTAVSYQFKTSVPETSSVSTRGVKV